MPDPDNQPRHIPEGMPLAGHRIPQPWDVAGYEHTPGGPDIARFHDGYRMAIPPKPPTLADLDGLEWGRAPQLSPEVADKIRDQFDWPAPDATGRRRLFLNPITLGATLLLWTLIVAGIWWWLA